MPLGRELPPGSSILDEQAGSDGGICPVCKSSRYLNPNMRFLINPECYHKMCESCVDRIFSHGPAPCPVAGCKRTLRKAKFRKQTFEDVRVEREVDIRRRVSRVFDREEEDFDTLLDYNNYLNEVEDITFNLINKIDVASTEKKIRAYMEASQIGKSGKHSREYEASMIQESRLALDKEQADRRAENSRKKSASEAPKSKDLLADDTTGKKGTAGDRVTLKRSSGRRGVQGKQETDADSKTRSGAASDENGLIFRGLKVRAPESAPKSYDPFGDISFDNKFYTLKEQYDWKWLEEARVDPRYTVGGYRVQDYCSRALTEAFAGLGVFLDEEAANST